EFQEKLGPRSREAIFMGYAPDGRAWHCCDTATGSFFNSRDVIFDETFSSHPFPTNSDDLDKEDEALAPAQS
ncbi:hypothetical protein CY34DRAFT_41366, partial [Suillus luteus UH-Slu-Lm8-n1]